MHPEPSRRDLLAAGAAGTLVAALPAAAPALPARRGTLKVGLVGCGGRGTGAAMQALRADKDTVLHAVGDMFTDRVDGALMALAGVKEIAERVQVPAERRFFGFDAYQHVIDSGVDVVLLVTPPGFRPQHFEYAVSKGKHVFMEKPVAVDGPGIRKCLAAAAAASAKNLTVFAGFCWRYDTRMREVFAKIQEGALGDVITVHTTYHTGTLSAKKRKPEWTDMEWQLRNWWHFTWISGDHIVEQAVHSVDRLAWALSDQMPVRCQALGGRQARQGAESGHAYDHFAVVYEYADGRRAFHTCRQIDGCPSDNTDYVYGTQGSAVINGWTPPHSLKDRSGKVTWTSSKEAKDMYQQEHDELFAGIRSGKVVQHGVQMCNSTLMAIMGRMAAYTGQTITWEQALNSKEDLLPRQLELGPIEVPPVAIPGRTKFS